MGKYVTVLAGIAALSFGIWSIATTWPLLWRALQATVPFVCVIGGLLAIRIGLAEIVETLAEKKTKSSRHQSAATPPVSA